MTPTTIAVDTRENHPTNVPTDSGGSSSNDNASSSGPTINSGSSMFEQYMNAISKIESEAQSSLLLLQQIQEHIVTQSYFSGSASSSSETLDDVTTSLLPYLTIEYQFGMCYVHIPIQDRSNIRQRQSNLYMSCEYFHNYLNKLQNYDLLTKDEIKLFEQLIELTDHIQSNNSNDDRQQQRLPQLTSSNIMNRDVKIAQFKQKQTLQQEYEKLQSLQQRRKRILNSSHNDDDTSDTTMLDGYDSDSLIRTKHLTYINMMKLNTFHEWYSVLQELPMISMMILQQQQSANQGSRVNSDDRHVSQQQQQQQSKQPLQLTQITQDAITGQLRIQRQEIQKKVYQPGWNQPTMSLDELAQREVHDALQRKQQQDEMERNNRINPQPRKYEQLVKDGLEDNIDLVDASSKLDEQWDTFKDQNKRGSGNKRGDVGDRNF